MSTIETITFVVCIVLNICRIKSNNNKAKVSQGKWAETFWSSRKIRKVVRISFLSDGEKSDSMLYYL